MEESLTEWVATGENPTVFFRISIPNAYSIWYKRSFVAQSYMVSTHINLDIFIPYMMYVA